MGARGDRVRWWVVVGVALLVGSGLLVGSVLLVGVSSVARGRAAREPELRVGMVFDVVTVEPQPAITGTMNGDCYLSEVEAGGHRWREQYDRFRAAPVSGRLVVTSVGERWAAASFTAANPDDDGGFVTTWDGAYYPSSDPCGF